MKKTPTGVALAALLGFAGMAVASDVEHYEGKPARTLEQAVAHFREYNERLEKILARDELTERDMERIHELTYTLENALRKIHAELAGLAGTLETVHQASERRERQTLTNRGRAYLDKAHTLVE